MIEDYDMGDYCDYEALERELYYSSLEKEEDEFYENLCDELQERIDKAIEYIKHYGNLYCLKHTQFKNYTQYKKILDILRGEDNESN